VVVIGGGLGGLAAAARLAKLGHQVTLVEQSERLGGALCPLQHDGFTWEQGHATLLPAALRDLFRKSGRPLESEVELAPLPVIREHRFADGSRVRLPGGSRSAQLRAVNALGAGLGTAWVQYVDSLAADWDLLRRGYLEHAYAGPTASPEVAARLRSRESLHARLRRRLPDPRLRLLASYPVVGHHHDARRMPGWTALAAYLEQRFGAWAPVGGMGTLATALARRLATRGVEVVTGTTALDVMVRHGRAVGVRTQAGDLDAEVVVSAIDPHLLPALAAYARKTSPARPPSVLHLGLSTDLELPPLLVLHGATDLTVTSAPAHNRRTAVTVMGTPARDPLDELAALGLDLREHVVVRVDQPPSRHPSQGGSSPWGVRWEGRKTVARLLGPTTPLANVYAAGAHAAPGAGIPFVTLSAAQVAEAIGPA
jgi:UDP-galactopyranose mutase